MNTITEAYYWRYATKKFDATKKVSAEDLALVLETARLAPSSYGIQPWKFYLVENPSVREKIWESAWKQDQVKDASHLLAFAGRTSLTKEDVLTYVEEVKKIRGVSDEDVAGYRNMMLGVVEKLSPEESAVWGSKQVYLALGFVLATLARMQIDACPMEGFDAEKVSEVVGATKEGYRVPALVPFGYRAGDDMFASLAKVRFTEERVVARV